MARLEFHGAAGEVTGSCFLVDTGKLKFLIDCGLFQGGRAAEAKNRRFRFEPRDIAFVLLSHAHVDHSGLLPRLVAKGFKGAIYATRATSDFLGVVLPDSGHLQEKEAEWRGTTPLYTEAQARTSLEHRVPVDFDAQVKPHASVTCRFREAGHILGSAILEVMVEGRKIVFSGDLGQPGRPIVPPPAAIEQADVLLIESTYGNRNHKTLVQTLDEFAFALNDTLASRQGNVVIPSFAMGRAQELLHFMGELQGEKRLPASMEIYVDSPMALAATRITLQYAPLPNVNRVHFTQDLAESKKINSIRSGAVIISASGMCEGGRIRHHLRWNISRRECAIVFVGFQAAGTLGRRIVDGAKLVRLFGEPYPVRAKVFTIGGLSAHADRSALLGWLKGFRAAPGRTFVVHGEPLAAHSLRDAIQTDYGWQASVAQPGAAVEL
ncbi:MAG TPA: MBL fold metallo-hydrolase [Burkholderiales bacterium]